MEKPGFGAEIVRAVNSLPDETIIRTEDIAQRLSQRFSLPLAQAKTVTNVKLKRMADKGEIKRLRKGAYCHFQQTPFGQVAPSAEAMMLRLLTVRDGRRIGYESGPSLCNRLGLGSLIPRDIEITTNSFGTHLPPDCHIRLRKPPTEVTDGNWRYLQFIDVVAALDKTPVDADHPEDVLRRFVHRQHLEPMTIIVTARRHYSQKTVLRLVDLFAEV